MKKILSLLLAMTMILSTATVAMATESTNLYMEEIPASYYALVDDDFEKSTPTASGFIPSWAALNSPTYDADMALIEEGDNNYLELTGGVGNRTNYTIGTAYNKGVSKLYLRTKVYLASATSVFNVNIQSYKNAGDANPGNAGYISLSTANTYGANNTKVETNKWYNFETVVDTTTKKYSMYINGEVINGRDGTTLDTTGTVDGIQFYATKDKGSVYVDDFVVYEDTAGKSHFEGIPAGYAALLDDDFEDSTPTASNFKLSWAALNSPAYDSDMKLIEEGNRNYLEMTGVVGNRTNYTIGTAYNKGVSKLYWRTKVYLASATSTFTVNIQSYKTADAALGNAGSISLSTANTYGANNTNVVANKWYTFETVIDTTTGKYSMYLDGEVIKNRDNVDFDTTGTVDGIQFFATKDKGSVYLDDFAVYEIKEMVINNIKADATVVSPLAANAVINKASITNNGAETKATVIVALYKDGKLADCKVNNVDVATGTNDVNLANTLTIPADLSDGVYAVRTFVLRSMSNISPMCEALVVNE